MRWFVLLLTFCVCAPLAAQDPVPDTTEAWRYFPLEIGNEWQYRSQGPICDEFQLRSVVGDTLIDNRRYFSYRIARFEPNGDPIEPPETFFLRFDSLMATIEAADGRRYHDVTTCPLDAAFGDTLICDPPDFEMETSGGVRDVAIGEDMIQTTVKTYTCCVGDIWKQYIAGIGTAGVQGLGCHSQLLYARVSGVEYGEPVITATEPSALPTNHLGISASPNPFVGHVNLAIARSTHQRVTIDVFDLLGRRVYSARVARSGETTLHLDATNWPHGLYLVRVTTTDGQVATTRITRQ